MRTETGFAALIFFAILGLITTFIFSTVLISKVNNLTESIKKPTY
ncbi:hypothetical protein [Fictibacillus barbaricus]|nr:hypothetical protein [Fictibacillus barbaricus]GGB53499.1 hypothetical protein GCM10007199_18960 [Fictibacillus barbaricus]